MKRFTKSISLLLAVLILLSSVLVLSAANIFAASATLTYSFTKTTAGYAQGTITLKADNGTYWLYWSDNTKALADYSEITSLTVTNGQASFTMPKYTAIPAKATKLIAINSSSKPAVANRTVAKAAAVYSVAASKQLNSKLLYTFGAISDPQIDNQSTTRYPYDETHFAAALETLAKRGVSFTVSSGDTVNDQDGPKSYAAEYQTYQRLIADSSYAAPIYEALGNHDVGSDWYNSSTNNNAPFIKATGLDSKKATINAGKPYFEVTEPTTGDHFIFMALEGGFYTNKATQFSTAQLDWLEGLLKKYKDDGKNIFIIEHANVAGWGSGDKLTAPYYYDLGLVKTNSDVARFIKLMETYKECVIITGHTHLELSAQYNYSDNNGTSAVMMHNSAIGGVRYLNSSGNVQREPAILGLSEGYIVEVYEDAILFNGTNMYYNETMPQCSYIIPMGTTEREEGETDPTDPIPTIPAGDDITITLKDETAEGWMKNNASEREIQLIDNATNEKYIMTSTDGYKTWQAEVPRSVTDITFRRVRTSNGEIRNQWDAGKRNGSVCYCVLDDAGGGSTVGNGYWDMSLREPTRPVQTEPATKPVTEPKETTAPTKPVTEPKETTVVTTPIVTEPKETTVSTDPIVTEPKETTNATEPVVIPTIPVPTTTETVVVDPTATTEATEATEPKVDELAPIVIVEQLDNGNIKVSAYPADENYDCEYQFAINGAVYQDYSDKSTFICDIPYDSEYVVSVSLKYADGDEHSSSVVFEIANGEAVLPEMPDAPTKPVDPTETKETQPTETTSDQSNPSESVPDDIPFYGDADLNGKVNVKDATTVQKHTAKMLTLEGIAFVQADVTGDDKVNIKDATAIQKYVAKIIDAFSVEEVTLASVGASTYTAQQDLEDYYTYSSYDQYMALKKAYMNSAAQTEITALQNALYNIAGTRPTETSNEITVYFSDVKSWGTVYAHIWGTSGDKATWPGTAMTFVRNNSSGQSIYKVTLDYSKYQNIIFHNNSGSTQTVDIALSGADNVGYYVSGGSGKALTVTTYTYS